LQRRVARLLGQPGEKYFDYFVFNIIDYIAPLRASAVPCYARGLAAAHSRKLLATLGGSTSTRPGVRKLILKTCDFVDISNATIPIALGGSTTASPPIVIVILRQQLGYVIVDNNSPTSTTSTSSTTVALTRAHSVKAKFSSSKSRLLFTFATPDPRGLRYEQSSCISLTSKKFVKALVAS
jgi:hypothetical protein